MKKVSAALAVLFLSIAFAHTEDRDKRFPFPSDFIIGAPAVSSCTSVNTSSMANSLLVISSNPVVLVSLEVTTPGNTSSVSLFATTDATTTTYTRQYGPVDTTSKFDFSKSMPFPSTMTISNAGTTAATVCIDYIPWDKQ